MPGVSSGRADVRPRAVLDDVPNNLSGQLSSFVGRDRELAEARRLLDGSRLLTLTGPGGSGKTRLSVRLAADMAADFPGGVYFVPLASVSEPELVPASIAHHVGLEDPRDGRPLIGLPMPGDAWRLVLPSAGERARQTPTLEEIQELVDQRAPEHVTVADPIWLACFRTHRRSADTYRRGRVLLAGDAVHIHTPAGGQGMNTGIMDAHNLAWKLALVVSGRSGEWLLDTYGAERRPVAAQVLRLTHAMVRLGAVRHPLQRVSRDALLPVASRLPAASRQAARRLGQIHVASPGSGLTRPGGGRGAPRPGGRAPDIPVSGSGTTRLYEVLRGGRHVLVISGSGSSAAVQHAAPLMPFRDVLAIVEGEFDNRVRVLHRRAGHVHLVRPDGYIAVRTARRHGLGSGLPP